MTSTGSVRVVARSEWNMCTTACASVRSPD
jgi:hypothetical protein